MAEFTKEQLIEKLERRLAVTTHYPDFEEAQLDAQIFKIALEALTAGMEQEPVAWLLSGGGAKNNVSFDSGNAYADPLREVTPLYTAPPAPVSVPAAMEMDDDFDSAFEHGKAVGWNAYRAAMLQGAEPVSNRDELPDGWVACSDRMPENKPGSYEYLVFESLNNGVHHDYWNVPDVGDNCQFTPFWNHYDRYVTHWMPLPAAPQQEVK
ncbi:DUF551 domain-containing protein [Escherichia coli]|nr:DUF551 domain-containing protein [Escherichia coli]